MLGKEAVARVMKAAKDRFGETMNQLRAKKEEHKDIKRANDEERKQLQDEERKARAFKFTKMEKKAAFLPSIKSREGFDGFVTMAPGEKFLESKQKLQILWPQRALEKGEITRSYKNYIGGNTGGDFFNRLPGQEFDKYDEVLKKAMQTLDRGLTVTRLRTKETFKSTDGKLFPLFQTKVTRTNRVWSPNSSTLNLIEEKTPMLLDHTDSLEAQRAITLERNLDKDIWLYNKKTLDDLATSTAKDVKLGKVYKRRILRKKRQRSKSSAKSASLSATR